MGLSIIIVNWNSVRWLGPCLESIRRQTDAGEVEVIVVDNASGDGCGEFLKREHPDVVFIQSPSNLGFAGANNLGLQRARSDIVLFLNPDTEVQPRALREMVACLTSLPDAGAVGARLICSDGSLQESSVQAFPTLLNQVLDAQWLRRRSRFSSLWGTAALYRDSEAPQPVDAVSGAALMIWRDVADKLGGFSDRFFMFSEDIDLCWRLQGMGRKTYFVPTAMIVHHGGRSTAQVASHFAAVMQKESRWRFFRAHRGQLYGATYRVLIGMSAVCRLVFLSAARISPDILHSRQKWGAILKWSLGQEAGAST